MIMTKKEWIFVDKTNKNFRITCLFGLLYFCGVLEWTTIVWIYYFLIKQDLQFSVLQCPVTVWNFYCQLWHLTSLKLVKRNGHMIILQLHIQYLKCLILKHLNTCYLQYIYGLMKLFIPWGTRQLSDNIILQSTTQIRVVIEITKWRFISLYVQSLSLCWETRKRGSAILHRLYRKLCSLSCESNWK